jgi:hypothetical protein
MAHSTVCDISSSERQLAWHETAAELLKEK